MRVTIVQGPFLPIPPLLGGAVEKIWVQLGQEFAKRGHAVTHVSRSYPGLLAEETQAGVRHRRTGGSTMPGSWRPLGGIDVLWPMRLVRDWQYCRRVLRALPPGDVIVSNTFFLPMLLPTKGVHGALYLHCQRFPQLQYRWYRHAARLQAVSSVVAERIRALIPAASERIVLIPNPIPDDFGLVDAAAHRDFDARAPTILFVGRIHPQKGVGLLLDAFRQLRQAGFASCKLKLVGPVDSARGGGGEEYARVLQSQAADLGSAVEWSGFEPNPAILAEHYRSASIFVYPSVDAGGEASPVAPVEAMACGCATVTSDLRCFSDYLMPGQNGLTFDQQAPDAASQLAARLLDLVRSPELRSAISRAGWETAQGLRLQGIAPRFLEDFEKLCV